MFSMESTPFSISFCSLIHSAGRFSSSEAKFDRSSDTSLALGLARWSLSLSKFLKQLIITQNFYTDPTETKG